MNPQEQFCHNSECSARGKKGSGNIVIHSQSDKRYKCKECGQTFTETKGTPFYRARVSHNTITIVLALLSHGCPCQAIVAAFGFDERTVADWESKAGSHAKEVHEHIVQSRTVDLQHVQADEIWVKLVGRKIWMAMAIAVPSRLWLGGVISRERNLVLITGLVEMVRSCALSLSILVCVDGLASYVSAFLRVFRYRIVTGRRGHPRLAIAEGLRIGQIIKRHSGHRLVEVVKKVVRGTAEAIKTAIVASGGGTDINTAYIERLNATFRGNWAGLVRRGRAIAHTETLVDAGMWLIGCAYNFCWLHDSLRMAAPDWAPHRYLDRTPAMAAGLTDHQWTMSELLWYRVPLRPWAPPKRRGRPPKKTQAIPGRRSA